MPFDRYLDQPSSSSSSSSAPPFSSHVNFQIPNLAFAAPTVAPGGGAEVLPAGLYPSSASFAQTWFSTDLYATRPPPADPHPAPFSASWNTQSPEIYAPSPTYASPTPVSFANPSSHGLPLYSSTGFDLLAVLSRVASRPHPRIVLGPVDMSCSFTVVDVRHYDSPIVYASPSFCQLTGYDERDVLGKNCRFLQAPHGNVNKGDLRHFTSPDAVASLKKHLLANKECQTSLTNYRKDGTPFLNLVTVIPVPEPDTDEVYWHVGFQVDFTQQPNAILQKLRDGTYIVNYSLKDTAASLSNLIGSRDWRVNSAMMTGVSKHFRALLADPAFIDSIPISTRPNASTASAAMPAPSASQPSPVNTIIDPYDGNKPLHMVLLEAAPDFIHVLSLKGAFLYAAPAVRHVLGYEPEELIGKSLADLAHKADVVPLMRELKESSALLGQPSASSPSSSRASDVIDAPQPQTKAVDLLFRMRHKSGAFVWVESRGRLHVEPGKGRKAIILCGRVREMPSLDWAHVDNAGGVCVPVPCSDAGEPREDETESAQEVWGLVSAAGAFLFVGAAVKDVLGWGTGEVIGRAVKDFIPGVADLHALEDALRGVEQGHESRSVCCEMERKGGGHVAVHIVLYHVRPTHGHAAPVVCQIRTSEPSAPSTGTGTSTRIVHPREESVFVELDIARGSSWQYELQQLKFQNQRLADDLGALEAAVRAKARKLGEGAAAPPAPVEDLFALGTAYQARQPLATWGVPGPPAPALVPLAMPRGGRTVSLKRGWESIDDLRT